MIGPWLQTAVLCEHVAGDDQGRLAAVNILEGLAVEPGTTFKVHLILVLVRGAYEGPIHLGVVALDPFGTPAGTLEVSGDPPAVPYAQTRLVVPIELTAGAPGTWWFDVRIGGATATQVPLRVDWRPAAE